MCVCDAGLGADLLCAIAVLARPSDVVVLGRDAIEAGRLANSALAAAPATGSVLVRQAHSLRVSDTSEITQARLVVLAPARAPLSGYARHAARAPGREGVDPADVSLLGRTGCTLPWWATHRQRVGAADHRAISLLTYFTPPPAIPAPLPVVAWRPYVVGWSDVAVFFPMRQVGVRTPRSPTTSPVRRLKHPRRFRARGVRCRGGAGARQRGVAGSGPDAGRPRQRAVAGAANGAPYRARRRPDRRGPPRGDAVWARAVRRLRCGCLHEEAGSPAVLASVARAHAAGRS